MFKEVSLETGSSRCSFDLGRVKIGYEPEDGSAGNHGEAVKSRLVAFIISALHH